MDARAKTLAEAKATAETQVKTARAALEKEVAAARTGLQAEAEALSAVIVRSVLRPAGTAVPAGGAQ
jgi:F0F1-type ATP synthase membrane subunit b/b'